ncbi:MAG: hypothetical protein Q9195_006686 [Heterodermia aff. obscurata]
MTRVLLTGGNGFVASHVLAVLLEREYSVVVTVRSEEKAIWVAHAHPSYGKDRLDFAIVEDIRKPDAFDKAVISDPPFEAVIHTASPYHYMVTDNQHDMLDPAIEETKAILSAICKSAPRVKRVVITSAFAAIVDTFRTEHYTYSEKDWNPVTLDYARAAPLGGYRGSKTLAERAAWDFIQDQCVNFTLTTLQPPPIIGPIAQHLDSLEDINESNRRLRDLALGVYKVKKLGPVPVPLWVDVRDVALAHVLCVEKPEASGLRFFLTAGPYSSRQLAEIIYQHFPQLRDKLPSGDELQDAEIPADGDIFGFDNSRSKEVLGLTYRSLEPCVVETVQSILNQM